MTKTTRKSSKKPAATLNMTLAADEHLTAGLNDDAILAQMLDTAGHDEIVEPHDDAAIEAALAEIEAAAPPADETTAEPAATEAAPDAAKPEKKAKKEKKPKEPKAPAEPKAPRMTYVTNTKAEVLANRLGDNASEFLLLEVGDAALEEAGLKAKMDEVLKTIDGCGQKKVQEKAVMLFSWFKKGGKLNEVMARAFRVLVKDGSLTSGDKGNLQQDLLAKPYSMGTARAQAGQVFCLFPMLKVVTKTDKGTYVANPDSLVLMKARAELGL